MSLCVSPATLRSRGAELKKRREKEMEKRKTFWEGRGGTEE